MMLDPQNPSERFLYDWGLPLAIGGGICLFLGIFVGWIIWRNTRKMAEKVESGNREAFAEYDITNDEVSKIKAKLNTRV